MQSTGIWGIIKVMKTLTWVEYDFFPDEKTPMPAFTTFNGQLFQFDSIVARGDENLTAYYVVMMRPNCLYANVSGEELRNLAASSYKPRRGGQDGTVEFSN